MHQRLIATVPTFLFLGLFHSPAHTADLSFDGRVRAQEAIERAYYSHQIGATGPFEEAAPQQLLRAKVERYLALSAALDVQWHSPITAEALGHEAERIATETRLPDRLLEIYAALGDDPDVIMECFVRPILVERMARSFFAFDPVIHVQARRDAERLAAQLRGDGTTGVGSAVQEDADAFRISVSLAEPTSGVTPKAYTVAKRGWDDWFEENRPRLRSMTVAVGAGLRLPRPQLTGGAIPMGTSCVPDGKWFAVFGAAPGPQGSGAAVWTGTHMLTWGGTAGIAGSSGAMYDPMTNVWLTLQTTPHTPSSRSGHSAVWTGSRMIVWGGFSSSGAFLGDGASYDPQMDSWTPLSNVGAPASRQAHTAVWTGSRMVVWGGWSSATSYNSGGRYDPQTDTWTATSTAGAPLARWDHTAVWTGSRMIVWGGWNGGSYYDSGGRYDPQTDTWNATSVVGAPFARGNHTAVWTGSAMIVWGGYFFSTALGSGGRYDPSSDTWSLTSTTGSPSSRGDHSAVWTGSRMIVWGGKPTSSPPTPFADGGRYDPVSDTWTPVSPFGPGAYKHRAVWSGTLMLIVSGRYDPANDTWTSSAQVYPPHRKQHSAVWTGTRMIAWGGLDDSGNPMANGERYDPVDNTWTPTSLVGAPSARSDHAAVWSGSRMVIWGGHNSSGLDSGARYDPVGDTWSATSMTNAPSPRSLHTAVWTGDRMIVWGGMDLALTNTGGRYDPVTDTWAPTSTTNAPAGRQEHTAVWTGQRMIVWGGHGFQVDNLASGGIYDPVGDAWTSTATLGAPEGRTQHTAVWTGNQMLVWGGLGVVNGYLNTGGIYDPLSDTWSPTPLQNAPVGRRSHTAVWTGSRMLVWGGYGATGTTVSPGGRYRPSDASWQTLPGGGVERHTAVWTGQYMIVWGGHSSSVGNDFGVYARYSSDESPNADNDSFTICAGDCNDSNPTVYPSAPQVCDGLNNNCADPNWPAVPANEADGDGDGHIVCQGDCNDSLSSAWATPGEAQALQLSQDPDSGVTTLAWSAPAAPGGTTIVYDVLRAVAPGDFVSGTICVASNASATMAAESAVPPVGGIYFYLVRAENGCPGLTGQGVLGRDSEGTPQPGVNCP
jgi:N-acetylneuraminic acid mutarotase